MNLVLPFSIRAREWAEPLVAHVWTSTIFLLLVLLVAFVLRRSLTASGRFAIVAVGIAKFAVPTGPFVAAASRMRGSWGLAEQDVAFESALAALGGALRFEVAPPAPSPWIPALMALWIGVAALLVARAAISRWRLEGLAVRSALPPESREVAALARARARLGVTRSVDLARGAFAEAPGVIGVLRPLVILPHGGCPELSDAELEAVLAHEVAHVRRRDNLVARAEFLVCSLFWFNPLLWIAQRMTLLDRERACDEAVAASDDERDAYLDALAKFCIASIAPRLPGVSCMATAKLKERMDYVMSYPSLRGQSLSAPRMALLTGLALIVFSSAAGVVATASSGGAGEPFAIKLVAIRGDGVVTVEASVIDNQTQRVVAAPRIAIEAGQIGRAGSAAGGLEVELFVTPLDERDLTADVTIQREGRVVQKTTMRVVPGDQAPAEEERYAGEPISLSLTNAELRDVLRTFSELTGLEIEVASDVTATISVNWRNVPWDQALAELLADHGLQYRLENGTMYVSKK